MNNAGWGGILGGAILASALEMAGSGRASYRPDTHATTSRTSQEADKLRADEKRRRREAKRRNQIHAAQ